MRDFCRLVIQGYRHDEIGALLPAVVSNQPMQAEVGSLVGDAKAERSADALDLMVWAGRRACA